MANRSTLAGCRKTVTTFLMNGHVETKYNSFHTLGIAHIRRSIVKAKGNRLQSFSPDAGLPKGSTAVQANHYWSKTCGCCGLNTKGDKEFADILKEELARNGLSSNLLVNLPIVQGFQIKHMNGSSVVLERRTRDESILVKFNINHATLYQDVLDIDSEDNENSSERSTMFTSKLPLLIEILKNDQKVIGLRCNVADKEYSDISLDFDHSEAPLEICEIALYDKPGDWNEKVYWISGSVLEEEFHKHLNRVLSERVVDQLFIKRLFELANSYEHLMYVTFLEEMRNFLICSK